MTNNPKSMWATLMKKLDRYCAALAYEPEDELFRRVFRLEEEVRALQHCVEPSAPDNSHERR